MYSIVNAHRFESTQFQATNQTVLHHNLNFCEALRLCEVGFVLLVPINDECKRKKILNAEKKHLTANSPPPLVKNMQPTEHTFVS